MKATAKERYQAHLSKAKKRAAIILSIVKDLDDIDNPNWADVGSMEHISDSLKEVIRFAKNEEE